ncbi:hypothetical protein B0H10DRAFT_1940939 [Mycena sp. CBHHK59/15]|nr:hypothetical protein B0H10DRAFT_1940939 [Mycena sp. CBHHK59/15]
MGSIGLAWATPLIKWWIAAGVELHLTVQMEEHLDARAQWLQNIQQKIGALYALLHVNRAWRGSAMLNRNRCAVATTPGCRRTPKGSASASSMPRRMCGMVVVGRKEEEHGTVTWPHSPPCPKRASAVLYQGRHSGTSNTALGHV